MRPIRFLLVVAGATVVAAALAPAVGATPGLRASAMPVEHYGITIRPAGGKTHGEHVTAPTFAVAPGLPVRITFTNYTHQPHTFTVPGLRVSALVGAAHGTAPTRTVVTFTPHAYGAFAWFCLLCPDDGSSSSSMRGTVYAIIQV